MVVEFAKSSLLGPVHSLCVHAPLQRILVGRGPFLYVYDLQGTAVHRELLFETDSIHGIGVFNDTCIVFSRKTLVLYDLIRQVVTGGLSDLDDLVLDAHMSAEQRVLVVGYAHNFIDVYSIHTYDNTTLLALQHQHRIQHPNICVLFSMSIVGAGAGICVVTGSVFGDVGVWNVPSLLASSFSVKCDFKAHLGVVFRIKWNTSKSRFATTSDDRSVRLWNAETGEPITAAWGHTCRCWDVCFAGDSEEFLASSSEEGDIRVWRIPSGECVCTLRGHGKNTWRIASLPLSCMLVSGGNDSCLKLWDVRAALCRQTEAAVVLGIPSDPTEPTDTQRRGNGVSELRISPLCTCYVLVMLDGRLWRVSAAPELAWTLMHRLPRTVSFASVCFDDAESCSICAAHPDGSVSHFSQHSGSSHTWAAHPLRTISAWFPSSDPALVLSASVKGQCLLWRTHTDAPPQLVLSAVTSKEAVASACALLVDDTLVIGDSKGSLSLLHRAHLTRDPHAPSLPSLVLSRQHGAEIVSLLQECVGGFCSLGHDGYLCVFALNGHHCCCISRLSCLPIKSPDFLLITSSEQRAQRSFFVGGYTGSRYIVYDIRLQYLVMDADGGGWKRPHSVCVRHASMSTPLSAFLCAVPVDNSNALRLLGSAKSEAASRVSYQMGSPLSCLELNCCSIARLGATSYVVVGGEDGTARAYESCNNELVFTQSLEMPHNVPIRAMKWRASTGSASAGVLVVGGGRLLFTVWVAAIGETALPLDHVFSLSYSGSMWSKATQDHRILSLDCLNTSVPHQFTLLLCDSRGVAQTCLFDALTGALVVLHELVVSQYPILSCALTCANACLVTVFGDSLGCVSVWSLLTISHSEAVRVCIYEAHSMGTNALDVRAEGATVLIVSGGDDQSLSRCVVRGTAGSSDWLVAALERQETCVGSAVQGIRLIDLGRRCVTVGFDQRLMVWDVSSAEWYSGGEGRSLAVPTSSSTAFKWTGGAMINIGDVEGLCCESGRQPGVVDAVVVGQGVQVFTIKAD